MKRSSQAKEEAIKAQLKEEIEMAIMDIQAEEVPKRNNVTLESLAGQGDEKGQLENHKDLREGNITAKLDENKIAGKYKGYDYKIDENLNVIIGKGTLENGSTGGNQSGSEEGNDRERIYGDYTDNLLYKVNFDDLVNKTNEKVTKVGTGIVVDSTNTFATFNGKNGLRVEASAIDSDNKLLGTTSKTITCWYRTSDSSTTEKQLAGFGNLNGRGGACS